MLCEAPGAIVSGVKYPTVERGVSNMKADT
jgi:hypothetical protein